MKFKYKNIGIWVNLKADRRRKLLCWKRSSNACPN